MTTAFRRAGWHVRTTARRPSPYGVTQTITRKKATELPEMPEGSAGSKRPTVLAMDHSAAFTCGAGLNPKLRSINAVRDTQRYGQFPEFESHWKELILAPTLAALAAMTSALAAEIADRIPEEWEVPADTRSALAEFIPRRAQFLSRQEITNWPVGGPVVSD